MNFWTLFLVNILFAFFLSYVLVKYGQQYKKYYSYFTDAPLNKFTDKILLSSTYKFKAEYGLSFFLIPLALVMMAILSYVLTLPLPGIDQFEYFFMLFMGEFCVVIAAALMIKVTLETLFQDKELREISVHDLYVTEDAFVFPITPLEGEWREIARKARKNYLTLKFGSILDVVVLPASGSYYRPRPPYYRVTLKDAPLMVYLQRNQFYGHEKLFLDMVKAKGIPVTLEDQLRD